MAQLDSFTMILQITSDVPVLFVIMQLAKFLGITIYFPSNKVTLCHTIIFTYLCCFSPLPTFEFRLGVGYP